MKYKVGDKVTPISKTWGSDTYESWKYKGSSNTEFFLRHGFLTIIYIEENESKVFGDKYTLAMPNSYSGDFFYEIDFIKPNAIMELFLEG